MTKTKQIYETCPPQLSTRIRLLLIRSDRGGIYAVSARTDRVNFALKPMNSVLLALYYSNKGDDTSAILVDTLRFVHPRPSIQMADLTGDCPSNY